MTIGVQYSAPMSSVVSADLAQSPPDHVVGDRVQSWFSSLQDPWSYFIPGFSCPFSGYSADSLLSSALSGAVFQPLWCCLSASVVLSFSLHGADSQDLRLGLQDRCRRCESGQIHPDGFVEGKAKSWLSCWPAHPSSSAGQSTQALSAWFRPAAEISSQVHF